MDLSYMRPLDPGSRAGDPARIKALKEDKTRYLATVACKRGHKDSSNTRTCRCLACEKLVKRNQRVKKSTGPRGRYRHVWFLVHLDDFATLQELAHSMLKARKGPMK